MPAEPDTVHTWTIKYRSVDKAGNVETYHACQVKIDTSGGGGDTTPPTVDIAGARDDWYYNNDVVVTLTATDEPGGSGAAAIHYTYDGAYHEEPDASVALPIPAVPNGIHIITYHARDVAGNEGDDETFVITMDTGGPVGYGRNASVRKGRYVSLRYLFRDTYSSHVWNVKVKVKNRSGRTVWSKSLGRVTVEVGSTPGTRSGGGRGREARSSTTSPARTTPTTFRRGAPSRPSGSTRTTSRATARAHCACGSWRC